MPWHLRQIGAPPEAPAMETHEENTTASVAEGCVDKWIRQVDVELMRVEQKVVQFRTLLLQVLSTKLLTQETVAGEFLEQSNFLHR